TTRGGEVKIVDSKIFPVTPISAAIVTLKPGGLRELHWHPNADEWQYYVSGQGRMTVFIGDARARTMDFEEGDVGYVVQSTPHYKTQAIPILCFWRCSRAPSTRISRSLSGWGIHR